MVMQELRRHLLRDRGLRREQLSISGYWRRSMNDDTGRATRALDEAADDELSNGALPPPRRRTLMACADLAGAIQGH
jgi:hypothetical protein